MINIDINTCVLSVITVLLITVHIYIILFIVVIVVLLIILSYTIYYIILCIIFTGLIVYSVNSVEIPATHVIFIVNSVIAISLSF